MTATVTTWHKVKVFQSLMTANWFVDCQECDWTTSSLYWRSAVDKALAHVDETKETT